MINLLPKEIKQRQRARSATYSLTLVYIVILVSLGLGLAALATYNLTQQAAVSERTTRLGILEAQSEVNADLAEKAAFIEDRLKAEAALGRKVSWELVLDKIALNTPSNVRVNSLKVTEEQNVLTISIAGLSAERRAVVLFRDKLESDEAFEAVYIDSINEPASSGATFSFIISGKVKNGL